MLAGWAGVWALAPGVLTDLSGPVRNISRLLVYKIGGTAKLPPMPALNAMPLDPPALKASPETVTKGGYLYGRFCSVCHGDAAVSGALVPDLRHSGALGSADVWRQIVIDGLLKDNGMVSWRAVMTPEQADTIRHYVIKRANEDKALEPGKGST